MICFIERLPVFCELKPELLDLKSRAESISRQLRGWADSLQNSDIKGTRYLTEKVRGKAQSEKERKEFLEELRRVTAGNIARLQSKTAK